MSPSLNNADINVAFTAIFKDISPSLASVQDAIGGNGTIITIAMGVVAIISFSTGLALGRRRDNTNNSKGHEVLPEYDPASPPTRKHYF